MLVICPHCKKSFSKYGIKNHIAVIHEQTRQGPFANKQSSYKGKTKETCAVAQKISLALTGKTTHNKGKTPSVETRNKISNAMKAAHAEGRAWNIGMSRWNNEPSYPEKFFMTVIENEFSDKSYIREFPFGKYSIDFAWPHLKKAIEIDGEQHQRFPEIAERDRMKDSLLINNSWEVFRIPWQIFYNNTKPVIQQCKDFIHPSIPS
jgi:very-short-patch-repair endonuclease